jgi:LmbE family N-acetylglucosaminyl deacetylase
MTNSTYETFAEYIGIHESILVFAPHADDETVGCGGFIALAVEAGVNVNVVLVTDGAASHPNSLEWPKERLVDLRKQEFLEALQILGVTQVPIYLNLPDAATGTLPPSAQLNAQRACGALMQDIRPDAVFTPWRREPHCDHQFTYETVQKSVQDGELQTTIVEYEVWTQLIGTTADQPQPHEVMGVSLDITPVQQIKLRALSCYRSQLGQVIRDDPSGFVLSDRQVLSMTGPLERYYVNRSE